MTSPSLRAPTVSTKYMAREVLHFFIVRTGGGVLGLSLRIFAGVAKMVRAPETKQ
jgi:hypothetical protein